MSTNKPGSLGEHLNLSLASFERFSTKVSNYATSINRMKALIDLSAQAGQLDNGHAMECIAMCETVTAGDEAVRQFVNFQSKFVGLTNEQRLQYLRIVFALLGDDGAVIGWLSETELVAADVPDYTDEDLKHVKATVPSEPESFRVGPSAPIAPPLVDTFGPVEVTNAALDDSEGDSSEEQIADDNSKFAWAGDPADRIDPSLLGNLLKDVE